MDTITLGAVGEEGTKGKGKREAVLYGRNTRRTSGNWFGNY